MSRTLVFAYGSNMHPERMLARVPAALPRGRARLAGHRLVFNKCGRDGSAKANLAADPDPEAGVWGVVWELAAEALAQLDPYEGGYARVGVSVVAEDGARFEAEAYVSERLTDDPVPYDWYLNHVLRGARAHELPAEYVAWLEGVISRPDETGGESS